MASGNPSLRVRRTPELATLICAELAYMCEPGDRRSLRNLALTDRAAVDSVLAYMWRNPPSLLVLLKTLSEEVLTTRGNRVVSLVVHVDKRANQGHEQQLRRNPSALPIHWERFEYYRSFIRQFSGDQGLVFGMTDAAVTKFFRLFDQLYPNQQLLPNLGTVRVCLSQEPSGLNMSMPAAIVFFGKMAQESVRSISITLDRQPELGDGDVEDEWERLCTIINNTLTRSLPLCSTSRFHGCFTDFLPPAVAAHACNDHLREIDITTIGLGVDGTMRGLEDLLLVLATLPSLLVFKLEEYDGRESALQPRILSRPPGSLVGVPSSTSFVALKTANLWEDRFHQLIPSQVGNRLKSLSIKLRIRTHTSEETLRTLADRLQDCQSLHRLCVQVRGEGGDLVRVPFPWGLTATLTKLTSIEFEDRSMLIEGPSDADLALLAVSCPDLESLQWKGSLLPRDDIPASLKALINLAKTSLNHLELPIQASRAIDPEELHDSELTRFRSPHLELVCNNWWYGDPHQGMAQSSAAAIQEVLEAIRPLNNQLSAWLTVSPSIKPKARNSTLHRDVWLRVFGPDG